MADAVTNPTPVTAAGSQSANEAWLIFWARRPVPILQASKTALAAFAGRSASARTDELVALVLHDPLLTAHILRHINQRSRSSMAADVVSIENVILLMGMDAFISHCAALPTVEALLLPKHAPHYASLLRHIATARLAARLAREFGSMRYDARLDEIYITALLADLPTLLRHLDAGMVGEAPAVELASVTLALFARWRLPEVFSSLLDESGASNQRAMLHRAALRLAEEVQQGWWHAGVADDVQLAAQALSIEQFEVWSLLCRSLLHFARNDWPYPQIFPPARWLAMQPGEWPRPKPKAAPQPAASRQPSLQDILRELQHAGESGASFNQIMGLAIRAQADAIGLKRIVFGLLHAGQNLLRTRYVVGTGDGDALRNFQVDLSAPHLLTRLMLKPQSIWLHAGNRAQFEALLPAGFRQTTGGGDFLAMSLFVEDKPVGLFYADNHGQPVSEASYKAFQQVCHAAGQALTRQAKRLALGQ